MQLLVEVAGGCLILWQIYSVWQNSSAVFINPMPIAAVALIILIVSAVAWEALTEETQRVQVIAAICIDALLFFMAVRYSPRMAIILAGVSVVLHLWLKRIPWDAVFVAVGVKVIALWGALEVYGRFNGNSEVGLNYVLKPGSFDAFLPLLWSVAVYVAAWLGMNWLVARFVPGRAEKDGVRKNVWSYYFAFLLIYPATCLLHFVFWVNGWQRAVFWLLSMVGVLFLYTQSQAKIILRATLAQQQAELTNSLSNALALAVNAKDDTTPEHIQQLQILARGMAQALKLKASEARALDSAALLHDIGMIAVPDFILNKPGVLSPAEQEKIKSHPIIGAEMLSEVDFPFPLVDVVRHHHERWDGKGYPDGLQGSAIPFTARLFAILDAYHSMRVAKPYRQAMSHKLAIRTIAEEAGKHFDPELLAEFLRVIPSLEKEYDATLSPVETEAEDYSGEDDTGTDLFDAEKEVTADALIAGTQKNLHRRINAAHQESVLFYELSQDLGSTLILSEVVSLLLAHVREIIPATTAALLICEAENETLKVEQAIGQDSDRLAGHTMQVGGGLSGRSFAMQQTIVNADPQSDFTALRTTIAAPYGSSLIVPLVKTHESFGVLAFYASKPNFYTSEHIRLAEAIADMATESVVKCLQHQAIERSALTDRLTGLPNLRAINMRFSEEFGYAQSFDRAFTFLMMDLDGFKKINDTFGHQAGDRFLREIAQLLKGQLRANDFIGRYAGDEFIAILPGLHKAQAEQIIERMREAVDTHVLLMPDGQQARGGVSIGVAEYDMDGKTMEELLAAADSAMYHDKRRRKAARPHENILHPSIELAPEINRVV